MAETVELTHPDHPGRVLTCDASAAYVHERSGWVRSDQGNNQPPEAAPEDPADDPTESEEDYLS